MALRLDKSRPFASVSPPWHGASYKQNGRYFDSLGELVQTPAGPGVAPVPSLGVAAPARPDIQPAEFGSAPVVVWADDERTICTIDGVEYVRTDVAAEKAALKDKWGGGDGAKFAELDANLSAPIEIVSAGPDDLTRITGIDVQTAGDLRALGIGTFRDIAALSGEEITAIEGALTLPAGKIKADAWIPQATNILAKDNPGAVVVTSAPEPVKAEMTIADLIGWAKREGQNRPWFSMRKAFRDLLSVAVTNETDAVAALIKGGYITQDEVKR